MRVLKRQMHTLCHNLMLRPLRASGKLSPHVAVPPCSTVGRAVVPHPARGSVQAVMNLGEATNAPLTGLLLVEVLCRYQCVAKDDRNVASVQLFHSDIQLARHLWGLSSGSQLGHTATNDLSTGMVCCKEWFVKIIMMCYKESHCSQCRWMYLGDPRCTMWLAFMALLAYHFRLQEPYPPTHYSHRLGPTHPPTHQ